MLTFSNSVLITTPSAGRLLCQTPTGRNTARIAAKRCTAGRKTRAQSGQLEAQKLPIYKGFFRSKQGEEGEEG